MLLHSLIDELEDLNGDDSIPREKKVSFLFSQKKRKKESHLWQEGVFPFFSKKKEKKERHLVVTFLSEVSSLFFSKKKRKTPLTKRCLSFFFLSLFVDCLDGQDSRVPKEKNSSIAEKIFNSVGRTWRHLLVTPELKKANYMFLKLKISFLFSWNFPQNRKGAWCPTKKSKKKSPSKNVALHSEGKWCSPKGSEKSRGASRLKKIPRKIVFPRKMVFQGKWTPLRNWLRWRVWRRRRRRRGWGGGGGKSVSTTPCRVTPQNYLRRFTRRRPVSKYRFRVFDSKRDLLWDLLWLRCLSVWAQEVWINCMIFIWSLYFFNFFFEK